MHHGLPCPATDNHASCTSSLWPKRGCQCKIGGQSSCVLLHLNPAKCPIRDSLTSNTNGSSSRGENKSITIDNEIVKMLLSSEAASSTGTSSNILPVYNSTDIHIFFILTPDVPGVLSRKERYANVKKFLASDHNARYFLGIYWENDWKILQSMFKSLRLPNAHMPELRGSRNRRGKYARWASILLAVSYAVQFRLPHLILLEDDCGWPSGGINSKQGTPFTSILRISQSFFSCLFRSRHISYTSSKIR